MKDEGKRSFKRYSRQAEIAVKLDTGVYKGRIIDYSDGICAIVEDAPVFVPGAMIDIKSYDRLIELLGEVVWTEKASPGLRIGVRRADNLRGSLRVFRLADLLTGLQRSASTGILEINNNLIQKKIYIKDGNIIFAASNQEDDSLGEVLMNAGRLTVEQRDKSLEISNKTGENQGRVLIELGYLPSQELFWALKHQVRMIIQNLFTLEDSYFEFQEGPLPKSETLTLKIDAADLIYHGIKMINDFQRIKPECPSLDTVLCLSKDPMELSRILSLDDTDKKILSYINGKRSIKEILSPSQLNEFEILKTIYALQSIGEVEVTEEDEAPVEPSPEEVVNESEEVIYEAVFEIDREFIEKLEDMYNKYERLGYYGILGIRDWASEQEIKEAYYRAVKEFHPDKHFSLPSDDIKEKLNTIFSYIAKSYKTLSDPAKRKEYNRSLSIKQETFDSKTDIAKVRFKEGRSEMLLSNFTKAEKLFAQAVSLDESIAIYHYYHGLAFIRLGMFKGAAKTLSNAVKLNPEKASYFAELGHVFLRLGFKIRAKNTFERALRVSPSNKKALAGMKNVED